MLPFKGLGLLAIAIPFVLGVLFQYLFGETTLIAGLGYLAGGILDYFLGKWLNHGSETRSKYKSVKSILNKMDGRHSLLYIRFEYWSIISFMVAILVMMPNNKWLLDKFLIGFGVMLFVIAALVVIREFKFMRDQTKKKSNNSPHDSQLSLKHKSPLKDRSISQKKSNPIETQSKLAKNFKNKLLENKSFEPSDHSRFIPTKDTDSKE